VAASRTVASVGRGPSPVDSHSSDTLNVCAIFASVSDAGRVTSLRISIPTWPGDSPASVLMLRRSSPETTCRYATRSAKVSMGFFIDGDSSGFVLLAQALVSAFDS
jgi:hypothetical protein